MLKALSDTNFALTGEYIGLVQNTRVPPILPILEQRYFDTKFCSHWRADGELVHIMVGPQSIDVFLNSHAAIRRKYVLGPIVTVNAGPQSNGL